MVLWPGCWNNLSGLPHDRVYTIFRHFHGNSPCGGNPCPPVRGSTKERYCSFSGPCKKYPYEHFKRPGTSGKDNTYGAGRIDAFEAVKEFVGRGYINGTVMIKLPGMALQARSLLQIQVSVL